MRNHQGTKFRLTALVMTMAALAIVASRAQAQLGCSPNPTPFTDLGAMPSVFCQAVAEAYFTGLTNGTSATTYSPGEVVNRGQMAAFVTRTLDQSLRRGGPRAALNQWWTTTPQYALNLGTTAVGSGPRFVASDGDDIWVGNFAGNSLTRVRASDGRALETWTGAGGVQGVLVALGRVFGVGGAGTGNLYLLDPGAAAGAVTVAANALGGDPEGVAFDGSRIWTANRGGSVSIITPGASFPWAVTNVATGFTQPSGIIYDGTNIWVTDEGAGTLLKLNAAGTIVMTVVVGAAPRHPVFDGTNIWVPDAVGNTVSVVRAASGAVLATLTGNGLATPFQVAFDGERVLVTHQGGDSVSLWKAADLSPIAGLATGAATHPKGVCSDGLHFWLALQDANRAARY